MLEKLEQKIGRIVGAWGLHRVGFHNIDDVLYLRENGTVACSSGIKLWATSGPYLLLIDNQLAVRYIFQYGMHQDTAIVLQNLQTDKTPRYFLRTCGDAHQLTEVYEDLVEAKDIDFINALASGNDFTVQIEPGANIFVPLGREVTIDHFASDRQLSTCHTPDYRIALNPQPITLPPVYMVVVNGAKMISGLARLSHRIIA
jgi:hypothetical protein